LPPGGPMPERPGRVDTSPRAPYSAIDASEEEAMEAYLKAKTIKEMGPRVEAFLMQVGHEAGIEGEKLGSLVGEMTEMWEGTVTATEGGETGVLDRDIAKSVRALDPYKALASALEYAKENPKSPLARWGEYAIERLPFAGMGYTFAKTMSITQAIRRSEAGNATRDDNAILANLIIDIENDNDKNQAQKIYDIVTIAPALIIEIATTSPAYLIPKAATVGGIKIAKSLFIKFLKKRFGTTVASRIALGSTVAAAKLATMSVPAVVGASVQSVVNAPRWLSSLADQLQPGFKFNSTEAGDIKTLITKQPPGMTRAVMNALVGTTIDILAERTGGAFKLSK
jgi:hypothetical protein